VDAAAPKEAKVRRKPPTQNLGSKTTEGEKAATRLIFTRPNRPDLAAFRTWLIQPFHLCHSFFSHP
jgi:hypothetical protein